MVEMGSWVLVNYWRIDPIEKMTTLPLGELNLIITISGENQRLRIIHGRGTGKYLQYLANHRSRALDSNVLWAELEYPTNCINSYTITCSLPNTHRIVVIV